MTRLHVLDHVHWDREWYRPHEQFRSRLVELVEQVCDQLERGERPAFHLDGQTVTIADVLQIRPDLEPRLAALVQSGRLSVGPWHVLADNQLVSGECLVRNLLIAREWGQRLGGLASEGYSPDAFGHPGDLPRILQGFGLSSALVWRGAPPEHARFWWRSLDGSQVLTVNQRYHEAEVLWDVVAAPDMVQSFVEGERLRWPAGPWLLMNGGDHLMPRRVDDRRAAFGGLDIEVVPTGIGEFFDEVRASVVDEDLPVVEGDLRRLGDRMTFLLPGTLSTRTYLKQLNAHAQSMLTEWAEPMAALAASSGRPSLESPGLLRHAWELMVQNAPHDSVCGCSVDEVHRDNVVRATRVVDIASDVRSRALQSMGLETRRVSTPPADVARIAVLNPHAWPVTQGVEAEVATAPDRWPAGLLASDGGTVPFETDDLGEGVAFEADLDLMPDTSPVRRHRLAFVAHEVPAKGYAVYEVTLRSSRTVPSPGWTDGRCVVQGPLVMTAAGDASVSVEDGVRTLSGLGRLVDGGDRGDTYNWDPPVGDVPVSPTLVASATRVSDARSSLRLRAELDLPVGLTPDRSARSEQSVVVPVDLTVTTWVGVGGLVWTISFGNTVRDHRLRFHVPAAQSQDSWLGDGLYSQVLRGTGPVIGELPTEPGLEAEVGVAPVQSFAALGSGDERVAVLCSGLPEVQGLAGDNAELAVTLLRSVGWLSRFDLSTRTSGAGPQFETPEAQCLGPQEFRLGVVWDVADDLALAKIAAEHRAPLDAVQVYAPATDREVLRVEGALLTAYKQAQDGGAIVMRLSNPTGDTRRAQVRFAIAPEQVWTSALDERIGAPVEIDGDTLDLDLQPYALVTLRTT